MLVVARASGEGGGKIHGPSWWALPCPLCPTARPGLAGHWRVLSPSGCKFIFLTTAITNSARMMEAMIEAKA